MRGTGIDLEVEIYATKLANETSPWTPMHLLYLVQRSKMVELYLHSPLRLNGATLYLYLTFCVKTGRTFLSKQGNHLPEYTALWPTLRGYASLLIWCISVIHESEGCYTARQPDVGHGTLVSNYTIRGIKPENEWVTNSSSERKREGGL
jgi:hypothetical protein